jgi:ribonuclease-3
MHFLDLHRFQDPGLLGLALRHASAGPPHNERLEYLGDAALDLVVAEALYRQHPDLDEGRLSELKASVVSRPSLAAAARRVGLQEGAVLGQGLTAETLSRALLANLMEAWLGAIYLDGGLEAVRGAIEQALAEPLRGALAHELEANPKQALQHLAQAQTGRPPEYELLRERGLAHARAFQVRARLNGRAFPSAWGRTRKEAERWAAHEALLELSLDGAAGGPAATGSGAELMPETRSTAPHKA